MLSLSLNTTSISIDDALSKRIVAKVNFKMKTFLAVQYNCLFTFLYEFQKERKNWHLNKIIDFCQNVPGSTIIKNDRSLLDEG